MADITYRQLTTLDDILLIQKLEKSIWSMVPIPIHQTFTAAKNGGIVLGAFAGEEIIGFTYAFPGYKDGQSYLCSHMMGIDHAYRGMGIGQQLKALQKAIAIKLDYPLITWTFDPLENINAYLNTHKLNGIAATYLENNYGTMKDSLNYGLPSDRFQIEWWISSEHANSKKALPTFATVVKERVLLQTKINSQGFPYISAAAKTSLIELEDLVSDKAFFVPIPDNFQRIKNEAIDLAIDWRLKTREVFKLLLSKGMVGVDVIHDLTNKVSYYAFINRASLKLDKELQKEDIDE